MANDAFMAGFDRTRKKSSKAGDDDSSIKATAGGSGGGLPGVIGKAIGGAMQKSRNKKAVQKAQKGPTDLAPTAVSITDQIPSAKHGGKVMKSGLVRVHRGETIVPAGKHHSAKKTSRRQVTKIVGSPVRKK